MQEEEDELNVESAITELSLIDNQIVEARFATDKTQDKVLDELSDLLEQRNVLVEKLQKAKQREFKEFVDSLNLQEIGIMPYFPVGRKCRLTTKDPNAEFINKPPEFEKSFLKKNKKPKAGTNQITIENYQIWSKRSEEIEKELVAYKKKKILSPTDKAHKLRLEAELQEIVKYMKSAN